MYRSPSLLRNTAWRPSGDIKRESCDPTREATCIPGNLYGTPVKRSITQQDFRLRLKERQAQADNEILSMPCQTLLLITENSWSQYDTTGRNDRTETLPAYPQRLDRFRADR